MTATTRSAPTEPGPPTPPPAAKAVRPLSRDWLTGEVTLVLPRWALAAAGLVALALVAVALD